MAEEERNFVSRWSRLKKARDSEVASEAAKPEASLVETPDGEGAQTEGPQTEAELEALVQSLPDIETMTESSNFTVFLQKGVPEKLKQRALRRLWRLNPIFANLDGLNDYDEDFTDAALIVEHVKTLYEVGKGMPGPKKPDEEEEGAQQAEADEEVPAADDEARAEEQENLEELAETPAPEPDEVAASPDIDPLEPAAPPARPRGRAAQRRWGA